MYFNRDYTDSSWREILSIPPKRFSQSIVDFNCANILVVEQHQHIVMQQFSTEVLLSAETVEKLQKR